MSTVQSRLRSPSIPAEDADAIVNRLGLELVGRPANLPTSWRNDLALLETRAGAKVLKRYRAGWALSAVHQEHSIIDELLRQGFAVTRLNHAPDGVSAIEHNGRIHAVFDLDHGRHFVATYLTNRQRRELVRIAGVALGELHRRLEGFEPDGAHHLGLHPGTSEHQRGLEWYLTTLAELASSDDHVGSEARDHTAWLRSHADDVAADLEAVSVDLAAAPLPPTVIHGDYGTHNVLYRPDGTALVHDLELARRDWRLLDIASTFVRMRSAHQAAFIAAYRTTNELPVDELALLPLVLRHHLLTGVIRSWQAYREQGGVGRLVTARSRIESVERIGTMLAVSPGRGTS